MIPRVQEKSTKLTFFFITFLKPFASITFTKESGGKRAAETKEGANANANARI
jgi:hypothetical protein